MQLVISRNFLLILRNFFVNLIAVIYITEYKYG